MITDQNWTPLSPTTTSFTNYLIGSMAERLECCAFFFFFFWILKHVDGVDGEISIESERSMPD